MFGESGKRAPSDSTGDSNQPVFWDSLLTRRGFLKFTAKVFGGVGLAAVGAAVYPRMERVGREALEGGDASADLVRKQETLERKYNIKLDFSPLSEEEKSFGYQAEPLSLSERQDALKWLDEECDRYPIEWFQNDSFTTKKIRILNDLTLPKHNSYVDGERKMVGGVHQTSRKPTKETVGRDGKIFDIDTLIYINFRGDKFGLTRSFGWEEHEIFQFVLHHEFFHHVDVFNDDIWLKQFGSHTFEDVLDGFITDYSRTKPSEDRAEIAGALFADYNTLMDKVKENDLLRKKVKAIMEFYYEMSSGLMDKEYWESVNAGESSPAYFADRALSLNKMSYEEFEADWKENRTSMFWCEDAYRYWRKSMAPQVNGL